MSEHTPGRLEVTCRVLLFSQGSSGTIARCNTLGGSSEEAEANAEHLMACWNACDGINPEAVPELLHAVQAICRLFFDDPNPPLEGELVPVSSGDFARLQRAIAKAELHG